MIDDSTVVTPLLSENLKKWSVTNEFDSSEKLIRKTKLGTCGSA